MSLLTLLLVNINIAYVISTVWNCSEDSQCAHQNITCIDGEDCHVYCTASRSCEHARITCPLSYSQDVNISCNLFCGDNSPNVLSACGNLTINGFNADFLSLSVNGYEDNTILSNVTLKCPCDGECHVNCGSGTNACHNMSIDTARSALYMHGTGEQSFNAVTVLAQNATSIKIEGNGSKAFYGSVIYCPSADKQQDKLCNIKYSGTYRGFWELDIFAKNGFHDVGIICDGPGGMQFTLYFIFIILTFEPTLMCLINYAAYDPSQCYNPGQLYMTCLFNYSGYCSMITTDGYNWACQYSSDICDKLPWNNVSKTNVTQCPSVDRPSGEDNSSELIIIMVVVLSIIVLLCIGCVWYCRWIRNRYDINININLNRNNRNYASFDGQIVEDDNDDDDVKSLMMAK